MREDIVAFPVAMELAKQLDLEVTRSDLPRLAQVVPVAGAETVFDYCSCGSGDGGGMGWSRLASAYPSASFPAPDATPQAFVAPLASVFEVGIVRCKPQPNRQGVVEAVDHVASAMLQLADMAAIRRAICAAAKATGASFVLGAYTPVAGGDCLGGNWTVTMSEPDPDEVD